MTTDLIIIDNYQVFLFLISFLITTFILITVFRKRHYCYGISTIPNNKLWGFDLIMLMNNDLAPFENNSIISMIESYGKICQFYYLNKHIVLINDAKIAKLVLDKVKGKEYYYNDVVFSQILNKDKNENYLKRCQTLTNIFNDIEIMNYIPEIKALSNKVCDILIENSKINQIFDMDEIFRRFSLDVTCKVLFQYDLEALDNSIQYQDLKENLRIISKIDQYIEFPIYQLLSKFKIIRFYPKYRKIETAIKHIKTFQIRMLNHIRSLKLANMLLVHGFGSALLDFEQLFHITEEDILDEIYLFLTAGYESTVHILSSFIYSLILYPDIQQNCKEIFLNIKKEEKAQSIKAYVSFPTSKNHDHNNDHDEYVDENIVDQVVEQNNTNELLTLTEEKDQTINTDNGIVQQLPKDFYNFLDDSPNEKNIEYNNILKHVPSIDANDKDYYTREDEELKEEIYVTNDSLNQKKVSINKEKITNVLPLYIDSALKESMRRYTYVYNVHMRLVKDKIGINIPRNLLDYDYNNTNIHINGKSSQDIKNDLIIPKGSFILINYFLLNNSKFNWGSDALLFKPERWLSSVETPDILIDNDSNESIKENNIFNTLQIPQYKPFNSNIITNENNTHINEDIVSLNLISLSYQSNEYLSSITNISMLQINILLHDFIKQFQFKLYDNSSLTNQQTDLPNISANIPDQIDFFTISSIVKQVCIQHNTDI